MMQSYKSIAQVIKKTSLSPTGINTIQQCAIAGRYYKPSINALFFATSSNSSSKPKPKSAGPKKKSKPIPTTTAKVDDDEQFTTNESFQIPAKKVQQFNAENPFERLARAQSQLAAGIIPDELKEQILGDPASEKQQTEGEEDRVEEVLGGGKATEQPDAATQGKKKYKSIHDFMRLKEDDIEIVDPNNSFVGIQPQIEVIDFTKSAGDLEMGIGAAKLDTLQVSIDRLQKRHEQLERSVRQLADSMVFMTSSLQMLSEYHVNQRVHTFTRMFGLVPADTKSSPFLRIYTPQKLKDYVHQFTKNSGVRNAEEAINNTLLKQRFVDSDGFVHSYESNCMTNSHWSTGPMKTRQGRTRFLGGEASVVGNLNTLVKGLAKAVRLPTLIKRYASRIYRAVNRCSVEDAIFGSEKPIIFLVLGSLVPEFEQSNTIPAQFMNHVMPPSSILQLEEHILESLEGEVYIPPDEELRQWIISDPNTDTLGIWKLFLEAELNGKGLPSLPPGPERDRFAFLLLLHLMHIQQCDLLITTCTSV